MKKVKFVSFDGQELTCFLWDNVDQPKGVIQILHGMTSHMQRYDELGKQWNKYGYIVFGDDHRPHGQTAGLDNIGKASKNNFNENVFDEIAITKMLKEKYNLPIFLFGHSYGSFLTQSYLTQKNSLISGAVLSGSAYMDKTKMFFGKILTFLQKALYRMDQPNVMMFNMTFAANNKPFAWENVKNSWLTRDMAVIADYNNDPYCNFYMTHGFYYSMMRGMSNAYRKRNLNNISKNLPLFIVSGAEDPLGGMGKKVIKLYNLYKRLGLNVKMKLYKGVRHELTSDIEKESIIEDITLFFHTIIEQNNDIN